MALVRFLHLCLLAVAVALAPPAVLPQVYPPAQPRPLVSGLAAPQFQGRAGASTVSSAARSDAGPRSQHVVKTPGFVAGKKAEVKLLGAIGRNSPAAATRQPNVAFDASSSSTVSPAESRTRPLLAAFWPMAFAAALAAGYRWRLVRPTDASAERLPDKHVEMTSVDCLVKNSAAPDTAKLAVAAEASEKLSSMNQSTVNLVKNIVGSGMLSLPSGVAAFSSSPRAITPALVVTLTLGIFSGYGFVLIADACDRAGETSYQGAWGKLVSRRTSWLPAMACTAKAAIGCISYSMILGDCLSLLLAPLGLPAALASRSAVMLALTASVLYPLCNMRSLAPLAKFSVLGVLSSVYVCIFILIRCLDGSYSAAGGHFLKWAPVKPAFAAKAGASIWSMATEPGFLVLVSILATAFLAHYNAPLFYEQLAPPQDGGSKKSRFLVMSLLGFGAAAVIFSTVMIGGFLTFGGNSMGLILNNYASTDPLAALARGAIALSLITAYPLVFFSLRKQFLSMGGSRLESFGVARPRLLNFVLLSGVTAMALSLRDLGKLAALAGACFGSFLIYVAPAVMVLMAKRRGIGPKSTGLGGLAATAAQLALIPLGLALGGLGAARSLAS